MCGSPSFINAVNRSKYFCFTAASITYLNFVSTKHRSLVLYEAFCSKALIPLCCHLLLGTAGTLNEHVLFETLNEVEGNRKGTLAIARKNPLTLSLSKGERCHYLIVLFMDSTGSP